MAATKTTLIAFEAAVQRLAGRCIVRFPAAASAELPSRGQVAVRAAVNGHGFETVVEPDGMRGHWLSLDRVREALDLRDGTAVTVEIVPTKNWPEPRVPQDLQQALDAAPDLAQAWPSITPMARWEWVRWVGATKNPQTRAKRIDVTTSKLRDGKRRPCCFDLSSCTDPELAKSGKLVSA